MIHVTCFRCRRRFEIDPVWVGVELRNLKARNPKHYQAHCPACHAVNKVSIEGMRKDLDAAKDEIAAAFARASSAEPAPEDDASTTPA